MYFKKKTHLLFGEPLPKLNYLQSRGLPSPSLWITTSKTQLFTIQRLTQIRQLHTH